MIKKCMATLCSRLVSFFKKKTIYIIVFKSLWKKTVILMVTIEKKNLLYLDIDFCLKSKVSGKKYFNFVYKMFF